jgi:sulfatase modifying factor 1
VITCETCRYFDKLCRRYPQPEKILVPRDWWCGEHSPREHAATTPDDAEAKPLSADPHLEMILIPPPAGGAYLPMLDGAVAVGMPAPYWIGKYPVTGRVWRTVMGTSPSQAGGGDDAPVDSVSWDEAVLFCEKLSAMFEYDGSAPDRAPFRLPTEVEWEWAASGGVREDRQVTPETGWFAANSEGKTHPAGLKDPNPFGLHDILGNVWEWTATAITGHSGSSRVRRGGSWGNDARDARVAYRGSYSPGYRYRGLGFRLARG